MKNIIGIFIVAIAFCFLSCEPIEKRQELTMGRKNLTVADIEKYVTIVEEMRDGLRSNWILCNSGGLGNVQFSHSMGSVAGSKHRIQVLEEGDHVFTVTVMNPDGSTISKDYTVNVQELYDMAEEWTLLCGFDTEKGYVTWTWKEEFFNDEGDPIDGEPYGMGDARNEDYPTWWCPAIPNAALEGKGVGATMTLFFKGARMVKTRGDGTTEEGTFGFNLFESNPYLSRAIATFTTSGVTVLGDGKDRDGNVINSFQVTRLTEDDWVLAKLEMAADHNFDAEGWGQANLWVFSAVKDEE